MLCTKKLLLSCTVIVLICVAVNAQDTVASSASTLVPRLVNFSGKAMNVRGEALPGTGVRPTQEKAR
jgi:hypothetical protein